MKLKTERELRQWLEQSRGRPVSDEVWSQLRGKGLVQKCLEERGEENLASLLGWADLLARSRGRRRTAPRTRTPKADTALLSEAELERARVYSRHLARLAERDHDVQRIRSEFFGGAPLSEEATTRLLNSVAARYFPHEFFKKRGIPLLEHEASLCDLPTPEGEQLGPLETSQVMRISWGNGSPLEEPAGRGLEWRIMQEGTVLAVHPRGRSVMPGCVLDEIREVGLRMVRYYLWDETDAQRFILTGQVPQIPAIGLVPLHASSAHHAHCPIVLRVQPWVRPSAVNAVYRRLQAGMYGSKRRPISRRNLALFEFVFENPPQGRRTWDDLRRMWNKKHRRWAFKNYRAMRQEFYRYRDHIRFAGDFLRRDRH